MPDKFSTDIHDFLSAKLRRANEELAQAQGAGQTAAARFQEGRIAELLFFRNYMTERYDLKNRTYF